MLESKGGRREKGEAGALLFKVSCPLCCSRPSLGPPDDLSSCSFEGQYAPRGPDTRTNDAGSRRGKTHESGHNLRDPKRGSVGPSPLKQARHSGESTRNESRSNVESTNLQNSARRERLRRPRSSGSSSKLWIVTEWRRHTRAAKLEPGPCTAANQRNGPWPSSQAPGLLG